MVCYTIGNNGVEIVPFSEARIALENAKFNTPIVRSGGVTRFRYTGSKDMVINRNVNEVPQMEPFID